MKIHSWLMQPGKTLHKGTWLTLSLTIPMSKRGTVGNQHWSSSRKQWRKNGKNWRLNSLRAVRKTPLTITIMSKNGRSWSQTMLSQACSTVQVMRSRSNRPCKAMRSMADRFSFSKVSKLSTRKWAGRILRIHHLKLIWAVSTKVSPSWRRAI